MHARKPGSSRRTFLSSAIAASAYVWIPKPVKGYTAPRCAPCRSTRTKPGVSKWELDTPALCVDLDKMEKNVATMQAAIKKFGLPSRPHSKTHKCAAIAKYQLANRIDRHLLRQAQRGGSHGRARRRQDPDDDGEPVEEQDPPRDGAPQGAQQFHPGGGRGAERAGSLGRGERGRRDGRRRHRRRGRDAERHPGRRRRAGPGAAHRQAAQPQAARDAVVRRRRAARQRVCRPQGARAEDDRTATRPRSRR